MAHLDRDRCQPDIRILREVAATESTSGESVDLIYAWKRGAITIASADRARDTEGRRSSTIRVAVENGGRRVRLLYLTQTSYFHEASQSLCHLIEGLDLSRYERYAIVGFSGVLTDELRRRGVTVIVHNEHLEVMDARRLALAGRLIRDIDPDLAHNNHSVGAPLIAALIGSAFPSSSTFASHQSRNWNSKSTVRLPSSPCPSW